LNAFHFDLIIFVGLETKAEQELRKGTALFILGATRVHEQKLQLTQLLVQIQQFGDPDWKPISHFNRCMSFSVMMKVLELIQTSKVFQLDRATDDI
jgi:hypothetical protein